jgi:type IV pilus assembly protein PilA
MAMVLRQQLKKKNNKKGFTLIEVIVVLVILAILAAIAIPALTGYIDKANQRAISTEAGTVKVALQAIASDSYAADPAAIASVTTGSSALPTGYSAIKTATQVWQEVNDLAGTTIVKDAAKLTAISWDGSKVTGFQFNNGTYTATLSGSAITVAKN